MQLSLRQWIDKAEEIGELKRIGTEVDWNEEMAAVTYVSNRKVGFPALLFENIKDHSKEFRCLFNIFGSSMRRVALTTGIPVDCSTTELISRVMEKFRKRIPPEVVDSGPILENSMEGKAVDILRFPAVEDVAQGWWPIHRNGVHCSNEGPGYG